MSAAVTPADRLRWIGRNLAVWVLALVLLAIALAVGVTWSLGLFTSSSANPRNVASAGSMTQVNSAGDAAFMSAADLVPGDRVEGSVSIRNAGDASGEFRLTVTDLDDEPGPGGGVLSSRLDLKVVDARTHRRVYEGALGELDAGLGTWQPEEERTYDFVVTFPESRRGTDDAYQGSTVTVTFAWHAVQEH